MKGIDFDMKKIALFLTILLTLSSYGCSSNVDFTVPQKDVTIEVIVTSQSSKFWDTVKQGARDASEELGIKVVFDAPPTEADLDKQIECLENAIMNEVDAIIISPLDANALNNTLSNATARNIPILTIDNTVTYDGVKSAIGTKNDNAGAIAGQQLASLMNNKGKVAVVRHSNAVVAEKRCESFRKTIQGINGITLLDTINVEGNIDDVPNMITECIKQNSDITGIFATNQTSTVKICETLKQLGRNDIFVVGFDSSEIEIQYIEEGILRGTMVQNPYLMGYLGVRNAYKTINGESIDSFIDTGITYVDITNLNDADIQSIIYPMGKE